MSQVRNLRAMFENKGDDPSPPDRGRSPGAPWPGSNSSDSPRPLSKVRTNFVAIEKDGRMGLRRDPSHESSQSRRPQSADMDAEGFSNNTSSEDIGRTPRKLFTKDAILESPHNTADPPQSSLSSNGVGALSDQPSLNPDKQVDEEQPVPSSTPADPTEKASTSDPSSSLKAPIVSGNSTVDRSKDARSAPVKKNTTTRPPTTTKPAARGPAKITSTSKSSAGMPKRPDAGPSAKPQDKPGARRTVATTTGTSSASKSSGSAAGKKPPPVKTTREHDTGFVKPKPKSPTKPVSLPASLMAPTASSVSKGAGAQQSISKQSGGLQLPNATGRAPSRASVSTTGTSTTKTIKRQASTINRPRPSLGPPPKKTAEDHPVPTKDSQVDESFLARMMRPTQSSSSKTHEKAPATPPRKSAARPSTSNTDASSRRASSVKRQGKTTSPAGKKMVSSNVSDAAPGSIDTGMENPQMASDEEPIPSASQGQEPDHEQVKDAEPKEREVVLPATEPADLSEKNDTPQVPTDPAEPSPEYEASNEAIAETAQVETLEEVLDQTEEAGHIPTPVEPADAEVESDKASMAQPWSPSGEVPGENDEPSPNEPIEALCEPQAPSESLSGGGVAGGTENAATDEKDALVVGADLTEDSAVSEERTTQTSKTSDTAAATEQKDPGNSLVIPEQANDDGKI